MQDVRFYAVDYVENKLLQLIEGVMCTVEGPNGKLQAYMQPPDFKAIKYYLEYHGKANGYGKNSKGHRFESGNYLGQNNVRRFTLSFG